MAKPNVPLSKKITELCKEIEKEEKIKILFAVENGSRAWRMESANSDYDVRFVFHYPLKEYISLYKKIDVIEKFYDKEGKQHKAEGCFIDIVGFDIFKYLSLLISSNPTAIEWLKTDIVYYGKQNKVFQKFAFNNFNPIALFYHYQSLCKQNYTKYIKSKNEISYKKYLYALRGLVNAKYAVEFDKIPPIDFTEAVKQTKILSNAVREKCLEIINLKKGGKEKDIIENIPLIDSYIESFLREEFKKVRKVNKVAIEKLNKELQKIILKK